MLLEWNLGLERKIYYTGVSRGDILRGQHLFNLKEYLRERSSLEKTVF